jgi:hypothetical protein
VAALDERSRQVARFDNGSWPPVYGQTVRRSVAANPAASSPNSSADFIHLHDVELLSFGNNEFEPDNACQSLLASIEREETFEFELERTGDVQNIESSATDHGCVLTT